MPAPFSYPIAAQALRADRVRRVRFPEASSSLLWVFAALVIWASAIVPSAVAARTFRVADNQTEDYPTVLALAFMDRIIQERTGGRHRLQIFHSGQLGDEKNTIEQTRAGAIDLNRVNVTPLTAIVPSLNALILPFQLRSTEHLHAVLDGPVGAEILSSFEAAGLVGLTFYDSGARSLYNDLRPVLSPADAAGMKIRVQPSELMIDLLTALGIKPVPLSYGQVLAALQTKLIDGAENNWPSYVSTGHYLSARYITITEHMMSPEVLLISRRAWDGLSSEDQTIFREAANASKLFMRERWRRWEDETRKQAIGSGAIITSNFNRDAFVQATKGVRERYLADPGVRALSERIVAVR